MTTASPSEPRLVATGTSYAGGVALQILVQALSLPILTRLLEPSEYGLVATALVLGNLLAVVVDMGQARVVTRAYFRGPVGPAEANALVAAGLAVVIGLSGLALLTAGWWGGWLGGVNLPVVQAAVLLAAAMAARSLLLGFLRATQRAKSYLLVMVLGTSGAQLLALLTAAVRGSALSYVLGLAAGALAAALLGVALVRPRLSRRRRPLWAWAGRFGLLLVPGELAGVAIWFSDRIVLERMLGLEAVGRYQVAYTFGSVLLMLAMGASQAWAPAVYGAADAPAVAERTRRSLLYVAGYGVAAVALAAPAALVALIPSEYEPSGLFVVTTLVALCVLPLIAQQGASHLLTGADHAGVLGAAAGVAAILNVVATLTLVPVLGLSGAALATLLTYVLWAAALTHAASRLADARFRFHAAPWVVAGVGAAVGVAMPANGWWLAPRAAGVIVCGLFVLGVVRPLLVGRGGGLTAGATA